MRSRIVLLIAVMMLLYGSVMTVFAHDVPDLTQKGSIEITMQKENMVVPGGTLTLYRVGEIQEENGNYSFRLVDEFADNGESLVDIQSPELAEALAAYASSLQGTTEVIDENGKVTFSQLELGLYMLVQKEAATGYSKLSPFLVSVPESVNGVYIYQVEASPKVELKPEVTAPPPTQEPTDPPAPTETPSEVPPTNPPVPTETPSAEEPTNPPVPTETPSVEQPENPPVNPPSDPPTNPPTEVLPSTKLPQTGQLNWPIPVMAVLGLWIFSVGWVLRFGQKKGSNEK